MRLSWTTAPISSMQQSNLFLATGVAKSLTTTAWLRRWFRMYIWKQWKKPKTKVANLRKLGIPAGQGLPIWTCPITNEKLAQAGYFDFPAYYELIRKMHLYGWTAVYRSVRTVVWEVGRWNNRLPPTRFGIMWYWHLFSVQSYYKGGITKKTSPQLEAVLNSKNAQQGIPLFRGITKKLPLSHSPSEWFSSVQKEPALSN